MILLQLTKQNTSLAFAQTKVARRAMSLFRGTMMMNTKTKEVYEKNVGVDSWLRKRILNISRRLSLIENEKSY